MDLQAQVFEQIQAQFSKKADAIKALAELLDMGQNAVYRRVRGESLLTPTELSKITQHFGLSLDGMIYQTSDTILMSFPSVTQSTKDFATYLDSITHNMQALLQSANAHIKYAAAEIPLFHYCFFPELIAFKLYTWGKTTWDFEYLNQQTFRFDLIPPAAHQAAERMRNRYLKISSTELWSLNVLDNTLNQIEYYYESGDIPNPADAMLLCEKMLALVKHLKLMAIKGKKFPLGAKSMDNRADFKLFHNEMVYTNNTIIISMDSRKAVFSTLSNPNFVRATDPRVTQYIDEWFDKIMVKSQPISSVAEKARNKYFNRLIKKIEQIKLRI